MTSHQLIGIGLLAVTGFLVGGVYTTWKTNRRLAIILALATLLAAGGAAAWLVR